MRFSNIIFAYIFINTAAFLLAYPIPGVGSILPISRHLFVSPFDVTNQFNIAVFSGIATGSVVAGILGIFFRQYIYAAGTLALTAIFLLQPIAVWILAGLPMMLSAFLAPYDLSWLISTFVGFVTVHGFLFLVGLLSGREL